MEIHIKRQLTTSQPLYPIFPRINYTEMFPAFSPVEAKLGATVAAAARVKVAATAAASTIHK